MGSLAALAIIATSIVVSVALNHANPSVRTSGTFLAALGCFAIVVWYLLISGLGIFENPRPAVLPVDDVKPAIVFVLTLAAFVAGVFLLLVTYWQSRRTDTLDLEWRNKPDRFGKTSRILHWVTAILFLSLIPLGIFTTMIPEETWFRKAYYVLHKSIGITVFILLIVRLVWNQRSSLPELDDQLHGWESRGAKIGHFLLYTMMIVFPISGFVMSVYLGHPSYFFIWELPLLWEADEDLTFLPGIIHKVVLPYLFYLVFGAHVLGALKHRFVDKHLDAFRRIVS